MSKHWCPIEGRECGRVSNSCCSTVRTIHMDYMDGFERCPFPTRIKPVAPDPGEGYELVIGKACPDMIIEKDWEQWLGGKWHKTCCEGERVGNVMWDIVWRRPIAQICPVGGERCNQADQAKNTHCKHGLCYVCGPDVRWTFEVCPWPSKKGT